MFFGHWSEYGRHSSQDLAHKPFFITNLAIDHSSAEPDLDKLYAKAMINPLYI